MNFFNIIDLLAEADPDVLDRFSSRRAVFNSLGTVAQRAAMATSPLFLGALFQKAYAGTASLPTDILNYALTLELLEADFYRQFLAAGQIPAGAAFDAITVIKTHEDAHVAYLRNAVIAAGGTPVAGSATTGIRFNPSLLPATYADQLKYAQVLEDTGVRAYKGRAAELIGTDLLTPVLQIHSIEARHAAHIRTMRGQQPWVSLSDDLATNTAYTSGVASSTRTTIALGGTTYGIPTFNPALPSPQESNLQQGAAGTKLALLITTGIGSTTYLPDDAAAAFDEPLQAAEVLDSSRAGGLLV
ncbi:ferritin-like domain-containing protein [Hymenobacter ruber]